MSVNEVDELDVLLEELNLGENLENDVEIAMVLNRYEDEVNVDIIEPYDSYPSDSMYIPDTPSSPTDTVIGSDFSDGEEIEVARGAGGSPVMMLSESFMRDEEPEVMLEVKEAVDETVDKTKNLFDRIKNDGEFARSISSIRISVMNNMFFNPPEVFDNVVDHLLHKVNNRPKNLILLSKDISGQKMDNFLEKAVKSLLDDEVPLIHSMFRLYLKSSYRLKDVAKQIMTVVSRIEGASVEYSDIYASHLHDKRLRYKTDNLKSYLRAEEAARSLKLKVHTTFDIKIENVNHRDMCIRWYDEPKTDGTRAQYIHIDHFAYPNGRTTFSDIRLETDVEVDDDTEFISTALATSAVNDLIDYLAIKELGTTKL